MARAPSQELYDFAVERGLSIDDAEVVKRVESLKKAASPEDKARVERGLAAEQRVADASGRIAGAAAEAGDRRAAAEGLFGAAQGDAAANIARQRELIEQISQSPGIVDIQAERGRNALTRALASQVGSSPGGFNPAMQRAALFARGQGQAELEAQAAEAKAREARGALESALAGTQGVGSSILGAGGLGVAQQDALLRSLVSQGGIDASAANLDGILAGAGGAVGAGQLATFQSMLDQEIKSRAAGAGPGPLEQILGFLGTAAGVATPLIGSDVHMKEKIEHSDEAIEGLLDALDPYEYEYKDPSTVGAKHGRQYGIMAQDLEKSEIGKRLVSDHSDGYKRVNYDPTEIGPITLSSLANLHRRLSEIEEKGKRS